MLTRAQIQQVLDTKFDEVFQDIFVKLRENLKDFLYKFADEVGKVEDFLARNGRHHSAVLQTKRITASQLTYFLKLMYKKFMACKVEPGTCYVSDTSQNVAIFFH